MNKLSVKQLKDEIKLYHKPAGLKMSKMRKIHLIKILELLKQYGVLKTTRRTKPKNYMSGSGFFDFFKSPKQEYNNQCKKMIEKYGDDQITSIEAKRTPVMKLLDKIINVISFGKWNQAKSKENVDDLFHLALIVKLNNGRTLVLEKNEVINISTNYKITDQTETVNVPMNGKQLTLNQLLENSLKSRGKASYFLYSGLNNNCQDAVLSWLKSSGLGNDSIYKWVKQDVSQLVKHLPGHVEKVMDGVTNLGARVDALLGNGCPNCKCKNCKAMMKGGAFKMNPVLNK